MKWVYGLLLLSNFTAAASVELTVVFGQSRPPFVDETQRDGISIRLFNAVAEPLGWQYKAIFASNQRMQKLLEEGKVDIAVEVQPDNVSLYYSQLFISYSNYAFYRSDIELSINKMEDLQPYSICAWQNAHNHLGIQHWAANKTDYREYPEQKWQVADWLNKRCQLLLIDYTLFKYHLKQFNSRKDKSMSQLEIETFNKVPLPGQTNPLWFYVGFTDATLRDKFDEQLAQLKQSGRYDQIRQGL